MYNGSITANAVTPSVNMKNRIINGNMAIAQRGTSAINVDHGNWYFPVDRFSAYQSMSSGSRFSVQQNAGSVTPPAGFNYYLGATVTSAYSVTGSDWAVIRQTIEGFNWADLGFGTANAKTFTASFWVRSSLTGTMGGAFYNNDGSRSYPYTYTINAANTWEYKTITVTGDTSGTWNSTNSGGITIEWSMGTGATLSGTAGAWAGAFYASATGATNILGTNGATLYITGVQLEVGSTATSFDYRPYGTELALCQRYCEVNAGFFGAYISYKMGGAVFAVPKRAIPSVTFYSGNGLTGSVGNATEENATGSAVPVTSYNATVSSITNVNITYGTTTNMSFSFIAASEL
jgi:hypothetical protein